jgi:hypothetical protein
MKLSAAHLSVIANTLHGSLSIRDGGQYWMFSRESRESTLKDVLSLMQEIEVEMTDPAPSSEND